MKKRQVIPGCDIEGETLEAARREKKQTDSRYTQKYVAGLVDLDQGIWAQWQSGTTRILDQYWLKFAVELEFDPFKTRPELLEKAELINAAKQKTLGRSATGITPTPKALEKTKLDPVELFAATLTKIDDKDLDKIARMTSRHASPGKAMQLAKLFLARAEEGL